MNNKNVYHRLKIEVDGAGYGFRGRIYCTAPEGSSCRMWCNDGCETNTSEEHESHELKDVGYCYQTEGWFDEDVDELVHSSDLKDIVLSDIPVDLIWTGEDYEWSPAKGVGETLAVRGTRLQAAYEEGRRAIMEEMREVLDSYPETCDIHNENDPITCGWKSVVKAISGIVRR